MRPIADVTPWIAEMRGRGLMWAFEICESGSDEPDKARTGEFHEACKRHGLLVGKGGLYGNVIRLLPALTIADDELEEGLGLLEDALTTTA